MNGRIVSRAWIKVYELYKSVNYFSNIESDTVNVFHICEAPGNFIISSLYYTQHNTKQNPRQMLGVVRGDGRT